MKKNLLQETITILYNNSLTEDDVVYVTNGENTITWDCYKYLAKNINYIQSQNILTPIIYGLKIVGKDWWIERNEAGNLSWFEFKKLPNKNNYTQGFFNPLLHSFSEDELSAQSSQYEQELILRALEEAHNTNINSTIKQQEDSNGDLFYAAIVEPDNKTLQQYLLKLSEYLTSRTKETEQILKNNSDHYQVIVFSPQETEYLFLYNSSFFEQINNLEVNLTLTHLVEHIQQITETPYTEFSYNILVESKDIINVRRKAELQDKELSMEVIKLKNKEQIMPPDSSNIILRKINIFEKPSTNTHKI